MAACSKCHGVMGNPPLAFKCGVHHTHLCPECYDEALNLYNRFGAWSPSYRNVVKCYCDPLKFDIVIGAQARRNMSFLINQQITKQPEEIKKVMRGIKKGLLRARK